MAAKVVQVRQKAFGADHVLVAEALARRAKAARALGHRDQAILQYAAAYRSIRTTYTNAIPARFAWVLTDYAAALRAIGNEAQAKEVEAISVNR